MGGCHKGGFPTKILLSSCHALKNLRVMSEANYNKLNGKITSKNSPEKRG